MKNAVVIGLIALVAIFVIYQYDPTLFGIFRMNEGFADVKKAISDADKMKADLATKKDKEYAHGNASKPTNGTSEPGAGKLVKNAPSAKNTNESADASKPKTEAFGEEYRKEGFENLDGYEGPAQFGSVEPPAGCYPRDQLTPSELLPKDMNSIWAEQNPMGPGSLKGKNFLSAGALIGVNTVGQSLRNANLQIRSEPPCPQIPVSIFNQSTIAPDISHRPLEIGS